MHASLANLTTRPLIALLAFAAWTALLVLGVLLSRVALVLFGNKRAGDFPAAIPHGSDAYWRLNRAHANAVENLPVFATIVLVGAALGVSSPRLALLADVVVVARVVQSSLHLCSGRARVVTLRATAFGVQLICYVAMIVETVWLVTL